MKSFNETYYGIISDIDNLRENQKLTEMAVFRKDESGLPVNIFIDDSGSWERTGHWKRIKFQADKSNHPNTREMIPMSISDEPEILVENPKLSISQKDLNKIKSFVSRNKDLLLSIEDVGMKFFYSHVILEDL